MIAFLSCLFVQNLFGQLPTISNFTPVSGPVGTTVIITGTNFSTTPASNIVIFGATRATVSASTATQLTVTVPVGATYNYITVLNTSTGLLAYSSKKFTPTFTPENTNLTSSHLSVGGGFACGDYPNGLAIADLDGDGKTDIAVADYEANTVSVLRNTSTVGSISYDTKIEFAVGVYPHSLTIGDLDGDGKSDLAVVNLNSYAVSVLRNTSSAGNISFASKVDFDTAEDEPIASIAMNDLDGDGKADLAVGTRGATISFLRNTSSSVGSISFAPTVNILAGARHDAIAIGDLDGDGKPEVVVTNYLSSSITVVRNTSTSGLFNFSPGVSFATTTFPIDVSIGDFDGDTKLDLAVVSYATTGISVSRNTSTGVGDVSFAGAINIATNTNSLSIDTGDMDGDGKLDIVVEDTGYYNIFVYKNTSTVGAISYANKVAVKLGGLSGFISIGDLDSDGKPDLAFSLPNYNIVGVIRNNPAPATSPTITSFTPTSGDIGTSVTITGSNFSATPGSNSVKFNGTASTVTASTTTSITTAVPSGATSGQITVTVGGNTGTSAGNFTVTVAQPEINIKQSTLTIASAGAYAFGDQTINTVGAPVVFTIENTGVGILNLSGNPKVAITGAHASAFNVIQNAISATVPAAGTTSFTVSFAPTTLGNKTAQLSIVNNDSNESPYFINLTGMGVSCTTPEKPTITQESNSDFTTSTLTSSAAGEGGTYQWLKDGTPIDNATGQSYTTSKIGAYTVRITVPGGCSATSDSFTILITDAEESTSAGDFVLYPNPAIDWLTVITGKWQGKKNIAIYETTGKQMTSKHTLTNEAKLHIGNFPAGTYIVTISTSSAVGVLRFIKR